MMRDLTASSGKRIIFFGTPEFAATILDFLVENGEQVVAAVTIPDRQKGRGRKARASAVKVAADKHSIPVLQPEGLRDKAFITELEKLCADIYCVVAFRILPREVFTLPKLGAFNVHASLLPKFRGAAPINRAIMAGETESGITTFLLTEKVDEGNVIEMYSCNISEDETAGELHDKLMVLGAKAALRGIRLIGAGGVHAKSQDDSLATKAPKIFPKDTVINFDQPDEQVHNFIRGLSPIPGAVTDLAGARLKILRTRRQKNITLEPGQFLAEAAALYVGTRTFALEITELQREGKRAMAVSEFLRGNASLFTSL